MKLTYDPRHNIAYIRLHPKSAQVKTVHVSDEQLTQEDGGQLVMLNEATGERTQIKLPLS